MEECVGRLPERLAHAGHRTIVVVGVSQPVPEVGPFGVGGRGHSPSPDQLREGLESDVPDVQQRAVTRSESFPAGQRQPPRPLGLFAFSRHPLRGV